MGENLEDKGVENSTYILEQKENYYKALVETNVGLRIVTVNSLEGLFRRFEKVYGARNDK